MKYYGSYSLNRLIAPVLHHYDIIFQSLSLAPLSRTHSLTSLDIICRLAKTVQGSKIAYTAASEGEGTWDNCRIEILL